MEPELANDLMRLADDGNPHACRVTADREEVHTPGPWKAIVPGHGFATDYLSVQVGEDEMYTTLEMKPADARLAAASPELFAVAKGYEQWEADLILCQEAWKGGSAELPTLTWELWDRLLELQATRNAAIAKATGKRV